MKKIEEIRVFNQKQHLFYCLDCNKIYHEIHEVLIQEGRYFCKVCKLKLHISVKNQSIEICYCPYCKVLIDDEKDIEVLTSKYMCKSCLKTFDMNTYKNMSGSGRHYKLSKFHNYPEKWTATDSIRNIVKPYYDDGLSYRNIREITKFSVEKIKKILACENSGYKKITYKHTELLNVMGVSKNDNYKIKIIKSLQYGCNYKSIEKLFSVSSKTIVKVKKEFELIKGKIVGKKRVVVDGRNYSVLERKNKN